MAPELGRLERVDLREVWKHEALDFTPWLAGPENLALLGDVLGIDLELEGTERNVGPFSADILCRDTLGGHYVLIENQLERTDHAHLGQLMTYAAGLNAVTIVWVAARFEEAHRAALDWLNEITSEGINFFGLEVEVWRIGDSRAAPKFNTVARPNDWTRQVAASAKGDGSLSDLNQLQLEYWTSFRSFVESKRTPIKARTAQAQHWMDFAVGHSSFWLGLTTHSTQNTLSVHLSWQGDSEAYFHLLSAERTAIDAEIGYPVSWHLLPGKKSSRITSSFEGCDIADRASWPAQHALGLEALERFDRVFRQRIKMLDPAEYSTAVEHPEE